MLFNQVQLVNSHRDRLTATRRMLKTKMVACAVANITFDSTSIVPRAGVSVVPTDRNVRGQSAIAWVGSNPTFDMEGQPLVGPSLCGLLNGDHGLDTVQR